MQNEGKRRKNSILTVLGKAEFIMLGDLEMSLGRVSVLFLDSCSIRFVYTCDIKAL